MNEPTADAAMTVEEDGIRVEKSFTEDEFPVPAVTYDLSSDREEAARVRIVDTVPESFPMDRVGFHPDYESENWTAYKDHRVEFERVMEPGETVETVFGIRSDDPDLDGFLSAPVIEHVPVDEEIEDVLGTDDTDAVREVLSGDRTTLPGMDEEGIPADPGGDADGDVAADPAVDPERDAEPADSRAESGLESEPEPRAVAADTTSAVTRRERAEEPTDGDAGDVEPDAEADDSGGAATDEVGSATGEAESATDEVQAATGGSEAESAAGSASPPSSGGIAAALAAEIRAGEVDDEDLDLLRSELDDGVPRSVDVRIDRLQSSVADIEAYADALAEFIDEEGTAEEVLDGLQSRVDEVESELEALTDRADEADAEREDLSDDVASVEGAVVGVEESVARVEGSVDDLADDVDAVDEELSAVDDAVDDLDEDVETLYEAVDDNAADLAATDDRVTDVEEKLGTVDEELGDVWEDIAEIDARITEIEEALGEDLDDVSDELEEIHDHLAELDEFRERLNEAFGP